MKVEVESDSDSLQLNIPNIEEDAKVTSLNSLPEKSRKKYEVAYKAFMDWRNENKIISLSEKVLLAYFLNKSNILKPTTLWTQYSMLRMTLNTHNNVEIEKYTKLKAFLKRQNLGYRPKKSKTFTSSQIDKFIKEAPDEKYILTKVALIMGVMGACRKLELYQMRTSNLNDSGSAVIITIPTRNIPRKFTIKGHFYSFFKKYADLRPLNVMHAYFFLNYQKGKCTVQRVGINKFGHMGRQIAEFLGLSNKELYTGHCFCRSSASIKHNNRLKFREKRKELGANNTIDEVRTISPSLALTVDTNMDTSCAEAELSPVLSSSIGSSVSHSGMNVFIKTENIDDGSSSIHIAPNSSSVRFQPETPVRRDAINEAIFELINMIKPESRKLQVQVELIKHLHEQIKENKE